MLNVILFTGIYFLQTTDSLIRHRSERSLNTEDATVYLSDVTYDYTHRPQRFMTYQFPSALTLELLTEKRRVHVKLYLNRNINHHQLQLHADYSKGDNLALYQSINHTANFAIQCSNPSCKDFKSFGLFYHNGEQCTLTTQTRFLSQLHTGRHRLRCAQKQLEYFDDVAFTYRNVPLKKKPPDRIKRAAQTYDIEIYLVIDYSIYYFWYTQNAEIITDAARVSKTLDDIKRYYAFLLNGIDLRYKSIQSTEYTINIIYGGIFIAQSSSDLPLIQPNSNGQIDGVNLLESFYRWVQRELRTGNIPQHDHAMLFTKYDITAGGSPGSKGTAGIRTLCTGDSQSVNEEDFDFISHTVAAHELGHSLGGTHDGTTLTNTCPSSDSNIMAAYISPQSGTTGRNLWRFSSCSIAEFENYINGLSNNCMLSRQSTVNENELLTFSSVPIGQIYDLDRQCQLTFGSNHYLYRLLLYSLGVGESICTRVTCYTQSEAAQKPMIPAPGTTCGDQKWCVGSECVTSPNAPRTGTCVFGDQPNSNCTDNVKTNPSRCANLYKWECCISCTMLENCTYGDIRSYCPQLTHGSQCYSLGLECCETCKKFEVNIPGCKFGDRKQSCSQSDCLDPSKADECCQFCHVAISTTMTTTTIAATEQPTSTSKPIMTSTPVMSTVLTSTPTQPIAATSTTKTSAKLTTAVNVTTVAALTTTTTTSAATSTAFPTTSTTTTSTLTSAAASTALPSTVTKTTALPTTATKTTTLPTTAAATTTTAFPTTSTTTTSLTQTISTKRVSLTDSAETTTQSPSTDSFSSAKEASHSPTTLSSSSTSSSSSSSSKATSLPITTTIKLTQPPITTSASPSTTISTKELSTTTTTTVSQSTKSITHKTTSSTTTSEETTKPILVSTTPESSRRTTTVISAAVQSTQSFNTETIALGVVLGLVGLFILLTIIILAVRLRRGDMSLDRSSKGSLREVASTDHNSSIVMKNASFTRIHDDGSDPPLAYDNYTYQSTFVAGGPKENPLFGLGNQFVDETSEYYNYENEAKSYENEANSYENEAKFYENEARWNDTPGTIHTEESVILNNRDRCPRWL